MAHTLNPAHEATGMCLSEWEKREIQRVINEITADLARLQVRLDRMSTSVASR